MYKYVSWYALFVRLFTIYGSTLSNCNHNHIPCGSTYYCLGRDFVNLEENLPIRRFLDENIGFGEIFPEKELFFPF